MKIQINATGKFEDVPLRIAQRMINKGIAHIVKEVIKPEIIHANLEYDGIEEISIKPKVKVKKKAKKEKKIEDSNFGYSDEL